MATHFSTLAQKIPWMQELGAGYCPWGDKESGTTERLHFTKITADGDYSYEIKRRLLFGSERLLLNEKTLGLLASVGEEFNPGPEMRLDRSELLCNKSFIKV